MLPRLPCSLSACIVAIQKRCTSRRLANGSNSRHGTRVNASVLPCVGILDDQTRVVSCNHHDRREESRAEERSLEVSFHRQGDKVPKCMRAGAADHRSGV
ncbi:unnamed protein product [Protopolystoma xenopodis]|uniref:Uncharacterized protein n=1 Tax=Protopolystoma xenopodis TaxID=117903 RepID=A0A3S5CT21_9PLAT|nr:unnamed protein product [Protopolystoma xenopodis]